MVEKQKSLILSLSYDLPIPNNPCSYKNKFPTSLRANKQKQFFFSVFSGGPIKGGSSRIFWGIGQYPAVAVAGLGDASSWSELDEINGVKENVRIAAAGNKGNPLHIDENRLKSNFFFFL